MGEGGADGNGADFFRLFYFSPSLQLFWHWKFVCRKIWRNLIFGHVLPPRLAMIAFRTRLQPGRSLPRGFGHYFRVSLALHAAPQQCWRHNRVVTVLSKIERDKNPPRFVLSAALPAFQLFERKHSHRFAVALENRRVLRSEHVTSLATLFRVP